MSAPKCNCKDCPDRTVEPNCHVTCKSYLEFVDANKEYRASLHKVRRLNSPNTTQAKKKALNRKWYRK